MCGVDPICDTQSEKCAIQIVKAWSPKLFSNKAKTQCICQETIYWLENAHHSRRLFGQFWLIFSSKLGHTDLVFLRSGLIFR